MTDLATIMNSYAAVSVSGITGIGGLVGFNGIGINSTIENSYATGSLFQELVI